MKVSGLSPREVNLEASGTGSRMHPHEGPRPAVVLVVEDDALVRMTAVGMLEDAGFRVVEACDADVAWAMLERDDDIEGLFTDVDMPGSMDGFDLARRVTERWPRILVVIASGRIPSGDEDMPSASRFLPKPYSPSLVVSAFGRTE